MFSTGGHIVRYRREVPVLHHYQTPIKCLNSLRLHFFFRPHSFRLTLRPWVVLLPHRILLKNPEGFPVLNFSDLKEEEKRRNGRSFSNYSWKSTFEELTTRVEDLVSSKFLEKGSNNDSRDS